MDEMIWDMKDDISDLKRELEEVQSQNMLMMRILNCIKRPKIEIECLNCNEKFDVEVDLTVRNDQMVRCPKCKGCVAVPRWKEFPYVINEMVF